MSFEPVSASGSSQFERPQEVVGFLEVVSAAIDFVDQILNAFDVVLAQVLLNHVVVGDGDSLLVDLTIAPLVNQLFDGLSGWISK